MKRFSVSLVIETKLGHIQTDGHGQYDTYPEAARAAKRLAGGKLASFFRKGVDRGYSGPKGTAWIVGLLIALLAACQGPATPEREPYCFELGCDDAESCNAECDPTPTCASLGCNATFCAGPQTPDDEPTVCACNGNACVIPYEEP